MKLGCFSISLAVKNLEVSRDFYQKLGFSVFAGALEHHYLIMKNGATNIGLFQGMFEGNIVTFNPGWDQDAQALDSFTDVREILAKVEQQGIEITNKSVDSEQGPASFSFLDPDGNAILIDQHR
ncbi:Catechol 2,3-dioxygenase [Colwellia chukchiensis]|uniref:Catechol 2,3-dioxygenase n=1 Tax=Colwellia chukchiensis TaxID=641665 RepID=A0A1H7SS27_9GAMM|nr:VOC family protein [Colwellia chukchiensis]SEL75248.1 Catechol 2,3-dioxygenase [Colwellia chukchiensis]